MFDPSQSARSPGLSSLLDADFETGRLTLKESSAQSGSNSP